jgi:DNA-binding PucR family transcriptional regulator
MLEAEHSTWAALQASLPISRFILLQSTPERVHAIAEPLQSLAALGESGTNLLRSIQIFLAENGSWEAAASQCAYTEATSRQVVGI